MKILVTVGIPRVTPPLGMTKKGAHRNEILFSETERNAA
jgi:hypothetical protein